MKQQSIIPLLMNPEYKTVNAVARAAKVDWTTVQRTRENPKVQREIEKRQRAQQDTARSIHKRSLQRISKDLEETQDPDYPLKALTVTTRTLVDLGDDESAVSPTDISSAFKELGSGILAVHARGILLALTDEKAARAILSRIQRHLESKGSEVPVDNVQATGGTPQLTTSLLTRSPAKIFKPERPDVSAVFDASAGADIPGDTGITEAAGIQEGEDR